MFTYPFCYTPAPDIVEAAERMIRQIDHTPALRDRFAEGKMLGVLKVRLQDGGVDYLYAFSGLAGGESRVPGFVPPIFDLTDPEGHYRKTEARISALSAQLRERSLHVAVRRQRKIPSVEHLEEGIHELFGYRTAYKRHLLGLLGGLLGDELLNDRRPLHEDADVLVAHLLDSLGVHAELDEACALRLALARLAGRRLARTDMRFLAECTTCTHFSTSSFFPCEK